MANDFINLIERKLIDELRDKFPNCAVYGQFPEAVNATWPAIVLEMVGSGVQEKFMGKKVTFGASNTQSTGEIYGVIYVIHLIVDKDSQINVNNDGTIEGYKQRRMLNYLMLNVANAVQDMDFGNNIEIVERDLQSWADVGFASDLELWGATATFSIFFENYREV
tara:strand:+ start:1032 stop:1526 length:495 start_codon:yes stop_codon:yes gene_type:complete